ncbi:MAG: Spy/CpxP family protein refolding chaperone [Burkholderiales bacterium]|nr:Spy/CpxP family protein refolding chaperone [Burkholderiales bacterium]
MRTSSKIIAAVAAAVALALAGAAIAHPGSGPGWGMGMGMGHGAGMGYGPGGMGPGAGPMGGRGPMGGGPGMNGRGFDTHAAVADRLAAFKAQLKITAAQEPAWKSYEAVVTQQAAAMQAKRDEMHAKWQTLKPGEAAPDMAALQQAMFAQRQAGWEAQDKALRELQAVLTPEQRAAAGRAWHGRGMARH